MRYLIPRLREDLQKKMVLLAGPRQCGKTTLAKSLLDDRGAYLNWDITKDRKVIREIAWPKDASLVVLDELHKAPKWKNLLKGVVDEFGNKPPLLVTGSARLDAFRRTGDALTGRHYFYRLHPIDPAESKLFLPGLTLDARVKRRFRLGGRCDRQPHLWRCGETHSRRCRCGPPVAACHAPEESVSQYGRADGGDR